MHVDLPPPARNMESRHFINLDFLKVHGLRLSALHAVIPGAGAGTIQFRRLRPLRGMLGRALPQLRPYNRVLEN